MTISKAWNVKKECSSFARISYYNLCCFQPVCTCEEEKEK